MAIQQGITATNAESSALARNELRWEDVMTLGGLSRRERECMDIVRRLGKATAADVHSELPAPPSYSAVRSTLAILERKGHLLHTEDGPRYLYRPARSREADQRGALRHTLRTFFNDAPDEALAMMLRLKEGEISDESLARMRAMIDRARQGER